MMLRAYEQDLTVSMAAKEATCSCAPSGKSGQLAQSQTERSSPLTAPGMWPTFSITPSLRLLPGGGTEPGHQKQRRNFRAVGNPTSLKGWPYSGSPQLSLGPSVQEGQGQRPALEFRPPGPFLCCFPCGQPELGGGDQSIIYSCWG